MSAAKKLGKQATTSRAKVFDQIVDILHDYRDGQLKQVADAACIHHMTLYWWKTGVTLRPRIDTLVAVAAVLGYEIELVRRGPRKLLVVK